ncbi:hypothetical protein CLRAG_00830 [Clostridium ragsdalei P11]|uniref:Uncharacterized protein n=1 Tax=Clostridium ragsdalei P11 TaxID=1353534 RepID=A0A1A6B498_9CLOT|nr:hypothetical protein CLRAG_00830 [Clostridium ragsdalei P11]
MQNHPQVTTTSLFDFKESVYDTYLATSSSLCPKKNTTYHVISNDKRDFTGAYKIYCFV